MNKTKVILNDVNFYSQVFLVSLFSSTIAELPSITYHDQPSSYGTSSRLISLRNEAPSKQISLNYEVPSISSSSLTGSDFEQQRLGYQTSEGLEIDPSLLNKIKEILIEHENFASSSIPQSSVGPPKRWSPPSSNVIDIHFDHLQRIIPVAQFIARKHYASNFNDGWNARSSSNLGLTVPSQALSEWQRLSNGYSLQKAVEASGRTNGVRRNNLSD